MEWNPLLNWLATPEDRVKINAEIRLERRDIRAKTRQERLEKVVNRKEEIRRHTEICSGCGEKGYKNCTCFPF